MKLSRTVIALTNLSGFVVSLLTAGCGQQAPAVNPAAVKEPPALRIAHPRQQVIKRTVEQPGRVEAYEQTSLFAKIPGYVDKIFIEMAGKHVKKGDLLAELYVPELREELKYKTGLVAQAKIEIELAERAVEVAQANTKTAESLVEEAKFGLKRADAVLARWQSESERMEKMFRIDKVVNEQDRDETLSQFRGAAAARNEADAKQRSSQALLAESRARCNKAATEVSAAQNRLELAKADEARVAALLGYARIEAPFDGVVSSRLVDPHDFVQPSSPVAKPLFIVVRTDKVRVFVDVPEADAAYVKHDKNGNSATNKGNVARIRIPRLNDKEFIGWVGGSSWVLDANQRTLRTEIDLDNASGELRPGMFAQVVIETEEADAWMVPTSAILTRDAQTYGFLLEKGTAVKTLFRVGPRNGELMQILKKQVPPASPGLRATWVDLAGDESFIVDHVSDLNDGQDVSVSTSSPTRKN